MIRLDKFLADSGLFSRKEASAAIRRGRVTVDGAVCRDPAQKVDETASSITADGAVVPYCRFRYLMLNKPDGTLSTTDDDPRSVMKLLPPSYSRRDFFPCGRLDVDTVGLLLITNDGKTAHALLSPKHHCEKTYRFTCLPVEDAAVQKLEGGVELSDFTSKPCKVTLDDPEHGCITVTEGKYHQIKRMFHAVGSEILALERVTFAGIALDPALERGAWRELTADETAQLLRQAAAGGVQEPAENPN